MSFIKSSLLRLVLRPQFPALLRHVQRDCATIFMLHRFTDADHSIAGYDAAHLRSALAYLRERRIEVVDLLELFRRLESGEKQPRGAVAFTLDDGYAEQAAIAAPAFSEFDCPVTAFVTTGFLDGKHWLWWASIEPVFETTRRHALRVRIDDDFHTYAIEDRQQRDAAKAHFTHACKRVPDIEKHAAIARLAYAAEVALPLSPPRRYAAMSWDQARECERMGMSFGPHTVTHPVLSRTEQHLMEEEITASMARLTEELRNPVPIFCYPNGLWEDFGVREIAVLRREGFIGAVVAEPGYANDREYRSGADKRYKVRRFPFPEALHYVIQ